MQVKDIVKNETSELTREDLIQKMKEERQVDLILKEKKTDDIGYLTWDMEQWSTVDGKRFIRTYQLEGRVLSEYTSHNIHDLNAYFFPDDAAAVGQWRREGDLNSDKEAELMPTCGPIGLQTNNKQIQARFLISGLANSPEKRLSHFG